MTYQLVHDFFHQQYHRKKQIQKQNVQESQSNPIAMAGQLTPLNVTPLSLIRVE